MRGNLFEIALARLSTSQRFKRTLMFFTFIVKFSPVVCEVNYPHEIVIIGDSTTAMTSISLTSLFGDCKLLRYQERCNYDKYYGIQYSKRKLKKNTNRFWPHGIWNESPWVSGLLWVWCKEMVV